MLPNFPNRRMADIKTERFCTMFRKLKRWFDMKGKRAVALLATITLLCSFTGCAGSEASNAVPDSVTSVLQSTHVSESKDSQDSETNSDNTSSSDSQNEPGGSQSDFDFDEAVKNITLFGSKISLPCTIEDFGEDYSLLETNLTTFGDISSCSILYQGKSIGTVSLIGYKNDGNLNDKKIVSLSLGFNAKDVGASDSLKNALYESRGWYNGLIEVDFAGLSFESTKVEVESLFGKPDNSDDDSADYKFYSNDQSNSVEVRFYQDKVKQIIIYMN